MQPANRYVLLDMHRAELDSVPEDNAVGLQVALERADEIHGLSMKVTPSEIDIEPMF